MRPKNHSFHKLTVKKVTSLVIRLPLYQSIHGKQDRTFHLNVQILICIILNNLICFEISSTNNAKKKYVWFAKRNYYSPKYDHVLEKATQNTSYRLHFNRKW